MVFGDFHDGLAKARIGNKFGFINELGEIVIPIRYDYCEEFINGLSVVTINKKWLVINTKGKVVIQPNDSYEEVTKHLNNMN